MRSNRHISIQGWTLSETLIMMIVAGVVFLAIMDGIVLFNRYVGKKIAQIENNIRLYEGYYRLEHIITTADSAFTENYRIRLYRQGTISGWLEERDSTVVYTMGSMKDTLFFKISDLQLTDYDNQSEKDSISFYIHNHGAQRLKISFPFKTDDSQSIEHSLTELENQHAYE